MPADLSAVRAAGLAALEREVALRAQRLRNEIVETLKQPGTGRTYRRGNRTHQASAPGDAPAVDRGQLWQHIVALKVDEGRWRVGSTLQKAIYLEFGTRRIAARPFLRPAADREQQR